MNFKYYSINQDVFTKNTLEKIVNENNDNQSVAVLTFSSGRYIVSGSKDVIEESLQLPMPTGSIIFSQNSVVYLFNSRTKYYYRDIIDKILPTLFQQMSLITHLKWEFISNDIVVNGAKIGSLSRFKCADTYCTGVFFSGINENDVIEQKCTKQRTKESIGLKDLFITDMQLIEHFNNACQSFELS